MLPYLLIGVFYIGLPVVQTDGRAGVRPRDYQILLGWVDYFIFVPMVLRCENSAIINFHFSVNLRNLFPTVGVLQLKHQASSWPFVILLLKPLRSFFKFFLIYFNYLVLVFYILQRVSYCHHYFNILLSLFYLLKPVKQFLAPRSNKSEQHNFLKISLIIMHRP